MCLQRLWNKVTDINQQLMNKPERIELFYDIYMVIPPIDVYKSFMHISINNVAKILKIMQMNYQLYVLCSADCKALWWRKNTRKKWHHKY